MPFLYVVVSFIVLFEGQFAFDYFGYSINQDVNVTGLQYLHVNSKLENFLFKNYSPSIRPVKNIETVTKIFFYPMITHVEIFDEKQETISISGSLYLEWVDEHLTWNKEDYNGVNRISSTATSVWKPNLMVYNSVGNISQLTFSMLSKVFINANGRVVWYPFFRFDASCNMDFSAFPYDSHVCPIIVGPWSYLHTEVEFEIFNENPEIFLSFNQTKSIVGGWNLESTSTRLGYWNALSRQMSYTKPKEFRSQDWSSLNSSADLIIQHFFPFVEISPKMRRFSNYFSVTIKMPALVSSLINIFAFLVNDFPTKITILVGNLLLQFCFMDDLMKILPYTTDSIPGIAKFFGVNFLLTVLAIAISVTLSSIKNFKESQMDLPIFAQRIQNARFMKILVVVFSARDSKDQKCNNGILINRKSDVEHPESMKLTFQNRWFEFAADMQAIFLIFYSILYSILFSVYL